MPDPHPSLSEQGSPAIASVVIPAHNEEASIRDTLTSLLHDASTGEFDVVVVCNGCSDSTAELARQVAGVRVVELREPSKIAALREGDRQTDIFPRIYLDGDVLLSTGGARALASSLKEDEAFAAGIRGEYRLDDCPVGVRLFYEFRQRLPVFAEGIIGAGVYAMSKEGRARFSDWPDVLGDDQFVYRQFGAEERAVVLGYRTEVEPPTSLRDVVGRGIRTRRGNQQLSSGAPGQPPLPAPPAGFRVALRRSASSVRGIASAATFCFVSIVVRLGARFGKSGDWDDA